MSLPKTYLVAVTEPDADAIASYLSDTGQSGFLGEWEAAGVLGVMRLVSMFAKMCYKSLVLGENANVNRIRAIEDNLKSVIDSGHGSVLEHVWLSFITTNCSRVFTHELVRHRVGTAFSQTSGRYVSIDDLDLVLPPELSGDPDVESLRRTTVDCLQALRAKLVRDDMPFDDKKRLTSAIRRLAPNGQANEIAWSCNIRQLRHMLVMRTSRHAEWEIRQVFSDVWNLVSERWPIALHGLAMSDSGEVVSVA
jgi:thymidylate synthase (FAD)